MRHAVSLRSKPNKPGLRAALQFQRRKTSILRLETLAANAQRQAVKIPDKHTNPTRFVDTFVYRGNFRIEGS